MKVKRIKTKQRSHAAEKQEEIQSNIDENIDEWKNAVAQVEHRSSIRKAALQNNVSPSTLYKKIKLGCDKQNVMPPCGQLLYPDEENFLVQHLIDCAEKGFPKTMDYICEAAHKIVVSFPRPLKHTNKPGRHFARNLIKRNKSLSLRTPSNLSRASCAVTLTSIMNWFNWFEDFLRRKSLLEIYKMSPDHIFNADETPLPTNLKSKKVIGQKGSRTLHSQSPPNSKQNYTALVTISAAGKLFKPYVILKGERISNELASRVPDNVDYTLSAEGYETQETFLGKL